MSKRRKSTQGQQPKRKRIEATTMEVEADNNFDYMVDLSWRGTPSHTHSDFVLVTVERATTKFELKPVKLSDMEEPADDGEVKREYPIHKCIVGFGMRKSGTLDGIFLSLRGRENEKDGCLLVLPRLLAEKIPSLFDYVYFGQDKPLSITTVSAGPLYILAELFEMYMLKDELLEFIRLDLSLETIREYTEFLFLDFQGRGAIGTVVMEWCTENISQILPSSDLLQGAFGKRVLVELLQYKESPTATLSEDHVRYLSTLVAEYCKRNDVGMSTILTFTDLMPVMDMEAAKKLSLVEDKLATNDNDDDDEELSDLQMRCIDILAEHWARQPEAPDAAKAFLAQKPRKFLTALLLKTFTPPAAPTDEEEE